MSIFPWLSDTREGIGDGTKWSEFAETVACKHFITQRDVRNMHVNVTDKLVKSTKKIQDVEKGGSHVDYKIYLY